MAIRRFLLASACSFSLLNFALPAITHAEEVPADVETAKHNFIGVINGTSVFVRSSPREDAYPTMKLDKGQKVTVVGIKYKWLKILPPEGSFAYVPKAYINLRGDGKLGRATREVIAKVGSNLNQLKTAPMAKIEEGQDVDVLGDQDEYYKVKPPQGTYLYVNESFVDPVEQVPSPSEQKPHEVIAKTGTNHPAAPVPGNMAPPTAPTEGVGAVKAETPSVIAGGPTTQPSAEALASAADSFAKLEADFKAANEKSITDQPIDNLLTAYNDLLKLDTLTDRMRQIAKVRVSTLELRETAKAEYLASVQVQIQAADRQKAMKAEHDEIAQRIKEKEVVFYTAVGTLRASSIQRGGATLYRLTDPASGRTVAYLRSDEPKLAALLGQFIGVKGPLITDSTLNMKMIEQPTGVEAVDPGKINDTIAAQIIPPSMVARAPTARASD